MFKLALVQMAVEGGRKAGNLATAAKHIREAAQAHADVVLLPETMDLGWMSSTSGADAIPGGETCQLLAREAQKNGVFICSGLVEKTATRIFNAAVIIDPEGNVIAHHRKINELDIAHACYARGDRLTVCDTKLGKLGLLICADANTTDFALSRTLCHMGAEIILSPAAWAVPPEHDNVKDPYGGTWRRAYTAVAKEFSAWFAGASNVGVIAEGPWAGWNCIGCSLVVDANGNEVVHGPYGVNAETILLVDVQTVKKDWA